MRYDDESRGVTAVAAGDEMKRAPRLFDEIRRAIRVRHFSRRTEQAYLGWARRFILANNKRHPRELGGLEVEAFPSDLAVRGDVAAGTQNQALSAILFSSNNWVRLTSDTHGARDKANLTRMALT